MKNLLAFDIGASNGRAILGQFDGERIQMRELYRFENGYKESNGILYWDIPHLYEQLIEGFRAFQKCDVGELDSFGIDTWGVDYGLLDENGQLIDCPRAYRMAVSNDAEETWKVVDFPKLFQRTGIATLNFNTAYQLYRRKREDNAALKKAKHMLMIPDLLGYFLSGEMGTEYTIATTTMLYNPISRDWDWESIDALGLPRQIFGKVEKSGTVRGYLRETLCAELGLKNVAYIAVGEHDTASAVAAIPGSGDFAFCSSGTWSLFGVETPEPVLTKDVQELKFSNEGTVQGGFRPLRNIMGLWLIQECRREWEQQGVELSWERIAGLAQLATPLRSIIDPDENAFFSSGNMIEKIQTYCVQTGQPEPKTVGEIARCVYESLALKYRIALEGLEQIKGKSICSLNIVGGGSKNKLLNQMVADATGRQVITGPVEGAAMGNLLTQAMALGYITDIDHMRKVVRASEKVEIYEPCQTVEWKEAYQRLREYMRRGT